MKARLAVAALAGVMPLSGCAEGGWPDVRQARLVKDLGPGNSNPYGFESLGSMAFFTTADGRLWRSDGTAAHTLPLTEAGTEAGSVVVAHFFANTDEAHGTELWKTDGTAAGTALVMDINPGPGPGPGRPSRGSSYPHGFTEAAGTVFFVACDDVHGWALWRTNGTETGTTLVADVDPRPVSPGFEGGDTCLSTLRWPRDLLGREGRLYFLGDGGEGALGLWRSDGTAAGTTLVASVPREGPTNPRDTRLPVENLTNAAGRLFFTTRSALWVSDGTAAGTQALPRVFASVAIGTDSLFFYISEGGIGRSDGTAAGTYMVSDVRIPTEPRFNSWLTQVATVGDRVYFLASDALEPVLWTSDGTREGTVPVPAGSAQGLGSRPFSLTGLEGRLYFIADDDQLGRQLWRADPVGGAVRLTDIEGQVAPGYDDRTGHVIGKAAADVLFPASGEGRGTELWALRTR